MAVGPIWPPHISDRPLRNSISYRPVSNVEHFDVEAGEGLGVTSPLLSAEIIDLTATYPMSLDEYRYWRMWWYGDTKSGSVPFELVDPMDTVMARFWQLRGKETIDVRMPNPIYVEITLPLRSLP